MSKKVLSEQEFVKSLKKVKVGIGESGFKDFYDNSWSGFRFIGEAEPTINFKITEVGENILVWVTVEEIAKITPYLVDAKAKLFKAVRDQYGLKLVSPWHQDAFTNQYYAKAEWDEDV